MKKNSIPKRLLIHALTLFCSVTVNAQGWVGDGTSKIYSVNSALSLNPVTVGIGTAAPSEQLHTTGGVRFQGLVRNDSAARIVVQDTNGKLFWRNLGAAGSGGWSLTGNSGTSPATNFLGTTDNQRLVFRTNNTEQATILPNGSIGIGITSPVKLLHVHNKSGEDNNAYLSGSSPSVYFAQTATFPQAPYNIPVGRIGLATRVGAFVETSDPGDMILFTATPGAGLLFGAGVNSNNNGIERMRISSEGNVGVNTITPGARLHVNGTVRFENLPSGTGNVLVIDASGNVRRGASTARTTDAAASGEEVAALKKEVDELKQALTAMQQQLAAIKNGSIDVTVAENRPYSLSSAPNPFSSTTSIKYTYPSTVRRAFINVTDINGRPVKRIDLGAANASAVSLDADVFAYSGTYIYSLELDGKVVESRKLLVAK